MQRIHPQKSQCHRKFYKQQRSIICDAGEKGHDTNKCIHDKCFEEFIVRNVIKRMNSLYSSHRIRT